MLLMHDARNPSRLLAKLVRDLLRVEEFESYGDLTEALKCRCARLNIRWTNDAISDAYRMIASNRPLIRDRRPRRLVERPPAAEIFSRRAAASFFRDLPLAIRTMPSAPWTDHEALAREADQARQRAAEMGITL